MGLDMGCNTIDVIKRKDFFKQVMVDLGLQSLVQTSKEVAKFDNFFA